MVLHQRLSVCTVTINSAQTLPAWAQAARAYADEIVVVVDAASHDSTERVAREHADAVFVSEHPRYGEQVFDWALRRTSGDWVLLLADDEAIGQGFADHAPALMDDRELTHYAFKRRWLIPTHSGFGWLGRYPWYPDLQLRLFRNIGSLYWHPIRLHTETRVLGAGRTLNESEGVMYHLDLMWRTRAERERKVYERYDGQCAAFYLFEDTYEPEEVVPVSDDIVTGLATVGLLGSTGVVRAEVQPAAKPDVLLSETAECAQAHSHDITVYSVEYRAHDMPATLDPGTSCLVALTLRNTSDAAWYTGSERGPVQLSYHIWSASGAEVVHEGARTSLPATVRPGDAVRISAWMGSPPHPGRYVVEWDMVQEGAGWFAERGARTLRCDLLVLGEQPVADKILPMHRRVSRALIRRFPFLKPYIARVRDRARG